MLLSFPIGSCEGSVFVDKRAEPNTREEEGVGDHSSGVHPKVYSWYKHCFQDQQSERYFAVSLLTR